MRENPFDTQADVYDAWYDNNVNTFESEVLAIQAVLPSPGNWVEVGVGSGRFAARLGISVGVEPSGGMAELARRRGIRVLQGHAKALPLDSESVDAVFFVTTLCFVEDLDAALVEAIRVLRPGGSCVLGLLPADSALGRLIRENPSQDVFFERALLRTTDVVMRSLERTGLSVRQTAATLIGPPGGFNRRIEPPALGSTQGSFVAMRAVKQADPR